MLTIGKVSAAHAGDIGQSIEHKARRRWKAQPKAMMTLRVLRMKQTARPLLPRSGACVDTRMWNMAVVTNGIGAMSTKMLGLGATVCG